MYSSCIETWAGSKLKVAQKAGDYSYTWIKKGTRKKKIRQEKN